MTDSHSAAESSSGIGNGSFTENKDEVSIENVERASTNIEETHVNVDDSVIVENISSTEPQNTTIQREIVSEELATIEEEQNREPAGPDSQNESTSDPASPGDAKIGFTSRINSLDSTLQKEIDDIEAPDFIPEITTQNFEAGLETSSFGKKVPVQLEWRNLRYDVKVGIPIPFTTRDTKTILYPMSGYVRPGEILAIMGPSGAGKTSLLNILSQRELSYTGSVRVNGKRLPRSFLNFSAYVEQDDVMHPNLTVFQVLRYAAFLRLPTFLSIKKRMNRVKEVMKILGLEKCRNTKVGTPGGEKGISGGERKRLAIAVEILKGPSLLFLDEPTSGMDAKTSLNIMKAVRNLARSGTTVIMTIHQPRSQIFAYFDKLLLLADGQVAYMGDASHVDSHFAEMNSDFALPKGVNIADHIIDLVTRTSAQGSAVKNIKELKKTEDERIKSILDYWSKNHSSSMKRFPVVESGSDLSKFPRYSSSIFLQFFVLLLRNLNNVLLDKMMTTGKIFQTLVFVLFLGSLYFRMDNNQTTIQDRLGLLFFVMLSQVMNTLFLVLRSFPGEFKVFKRENASRAYSVLAYYLAKVLSEIPHLIVFPLFFGAALYWTVGFHASAGRFFTFLLILVTVSLTGVSLGEVISVLSPNENLALLIAPILLVVLIFFSGFYIAVANIPPYYVWIYYISLFAYGFEALLINEFYDLKFVCKPDEFIEGTNICSVTDGIQVIRRIGMNENYYKVWINIGALLLIMIMLKIFGFVALAIRTSRLRSNFKRFLRDLREERLEKKRMKGMINSDSQDDQIHSFDELDKEVKPTTQEG